MPRTLPYLQLDQWAGKEQVGSLLSKAAALPQVVVQQSRMASAATTALALADQFAKGPAEAFIDLAEFCHLHATPQGGVHLTLPHGAMEAAIDRGWGELHPVAQTGSLSPNLLALYAPRDEHETAVVLVLIEISRRFAGGIW
jgi:hypothetical protein